MESNSLTSFFMEVPDIQSTGNLEKKCILIPFCSSTFSESTSTLFWTSSVFLQDLVSLDKLDKLEPLRQFVSLQILEFLRRNCMQSYVRITLKLCFLALLFLHNCSITFTNSLHKLTSFSYVIPGKHTIPLCI